MFKNGSRSFSRMCRPGLSLAMALLVCFSALAASAQLNEAGNSENNGLPPQQPGETQDPRLPLKQPDRPLVLITAVETEPEQIVAGEPFELTLTLTNYGNQQARRIVATLKSMEGENTLKFFSPLGQSNTRFMSHLSSWQARTLTCKLITNTAVTGGIYNLVFHLFYINEEGEPFESTAVAGVVVQPREAALDLVELQFPDTVMEGETFFLSGSVVNSGASSVRGVGVTAESSEHFYVENGQVYFGTFNEGDLDFFEFFVTPARHGPGTLSLELFYTDAMNSKQSRGQVVEIRVIQRVVEEMPEIPAGENRNSSRSGFKRFLYALFGLGGS